MKIISPLFLVLILAGCADKLPGPFNHREVSLKLDRFEPAPVRNNHVMPSEDFWLANGEEVFVVWNEYNVEFSFGANPPSSCNLCRDDAQITPDDGEFLVDCGSLNSPEGQDARIPARPIVRVIERPLADMNGVVNGITEFDFRAGCFSFGNGASAAFVPTRDAQFSLMPVIPSDAVGDVDGEAGEAKLAVHLIRRDVEEQGPPPFKLDAVDDSTWQWSVRENNGKWLVNFSNHLRVTKVRVLRGRMIGEEFAPTDMAKPFVTPYQIRLAYPESGGLAREIQSCPGSRIDATGYLNLADCRRIIGGGSGPPEFPTPTYTHELPQDRLTWKVIFSASQGFPPPALDNGEELRIEFNLQVL